MDPIMVYLKKNAFPEDKIDAKMLRLKLAHYVIYDNKLYRRSYLMPLLR